MNTISQKYTSRLWTAKRLSLLLTLIAILLWSYSIIHLKLNFGYLGFIHSLPITFFIALCLMTIASTILWFSSKNQGKLLFFQLLFLIVVLYLTPILAGLTVGLSDTAYSSLGPIDYISRHGHVNPAVEVRFNWPGLFIFSSMSNDILGTDITEKLLVYTPFILPLLFLPPLYLFLRSMLDDTESNYRWAAAWIFYLALPIGFTGYLYSQTLGFLLLLFFLFLIIISYSWEQGIRTPIYWLVSIIIFSALVITHFLTAIAGLFILIAPYVVRKAKPIRLIVLILLCGLFVGMWAYFAPYTTYTPEQPPGIDLPPSTEQPSEVEQPTTIDPGSSFEPGFSGQFSGLLKKAFRLDIYIKEMVSRVGSGTHAAIAIIRISVFLVFLLAVLIGSIIVYRLRRKFRTNLTILAIGISLAALDIIIGAIYGSETAGRIFLFLLPLIAYFGVKLLYSRATAIVICISLLSASVLFFIYSLGDAEINYQSPSQAAGLHFFHERTEQGEIITFNHSAWGRVENIEFYTCIELDPFTSEPLQVPVKEEVENTLFSENTGDFPRYFALCRVDESRFDYLYSDAEYIIELRSSINANTDWHLIYTSPDVTLYSNPSKKG